MVFSEPTSLCLLRNRRDFSQMPPSFGSAKIIFVSFGTSEANIFDIFEHFSICYGPVSRYRFGTPEQILYVILEPRLGRLCTDFISRLALLTPGTSENLYLLYFQENYRDFRASCIFLCDCLIFCFLYE